MVIIMLTGSIVSFGFTACCIVYCRFLYLDILNNCVMQLPLPVAESNIFYDIENQVCGIIR